MTKGAGQLIQENVNEPSFFAMIPKMAIVGLNPYELALYCHYKMTASEQGVCYKSNKTLAQETGMSIRKMQDARTALIAKGYITLTHTDDGSGHINQPPAISIVNVWTENRKIYSKSMPTPSTECLGGYAPHANPLAPDAGGYAPHATKEYPNEEKPSKNTNTNTPAPVGAVPPTQPPKVADSKTKTPAPKPVKGKLPTYPKSVNSWEWRHLERYASENPTVNALAALQDPMRKCLKELSTAVVARHCVTLYQELQRNKISVERYSSLYQVGKGRAKVGESWDIFQYMLWALPKWLEGNGSQPTITLIDDPTPVKPRSMEELRALAAEMRREKAAS